MMAEFALIAPLAVLLLTGVVLLALAVTNIVQLSNAARDGARLAAACGGAGSDGSYGSDAGLQTATPSFLPDGSRCSAANIQSYLSKRLNGIPGGVQFSPQPQVLVGQLGGVNQNKDLPACSVGGIVQVDIQYDQPVYIPLVGQFLSNDGTGTGRNIQAQAQATCEQ